MDVKLNNKNKLSDINGTCQLWLSFWVLSFCTYCSLSKKKKKRQQREPDKDLFDMENLIKAVG